MDQARLAASTLDFKRFVQQVMTGTRQMSQAQARSPEQELLIQYMQKKRSNEILLLFLYLIVFLM